MKKHEHPDISFLDIDIRLLVPLMASILTILCWARAPGILIPLILLALVMMRFRTLRQSAVLLIIGVALMSLNIQARNIPIFFNDDQQQWQAIILSEGSQQNEYKVDLMPVSDSAFQYQVKAKLKTKNSEMRVGDGIRFDGKIKYNKFGFSVTPAGRIEIIDHAQRQFIAHRNIRNNLVAHEEPSDVGLFLGIAYGDDSLISKEDRDIFRAVGITHLTAVSGSNIALVAATSFSLIAVAVKRRAPALSGTMVITFAYCYFVGLDGSVMRAFIFALLGFGAAITESSRTTFALCCSALTLLLSFQPLLLWDVGFVLSATITLGLIVLCPPLTFLLTLYVGELGAAFLAVNLVAHLISTPVSAFYFDQIYTYSLPVNILVAAMIPIILGLGIVYLLIYVVTNRDASILFNCAEPLLHIIQFLSRSFANLTGSVLEVHNGLVLAALVIGSTLTSCIIVRSGRRAASQTPEPAIVI